MQVFEVVSRVYLVGHKSTQLFERYENPDKQVLHEVSAHPKFLDKTTEEHRNIRRQNIYKKIFVNGETTCLKDEYEFNSTTNFRYYNKAYFWS